MKWLQSGIGIEQLEADWLLPKERVIRCGKDLVILTERTIRSSVEPTVDETDLRLLIESYR